MFNDKNAFKKEFESMLEKVYEKPVDVCSKQELFNNLVHVIFKNAADIKYKDAEKHALNKDKKIYYFSMEFLVGKFLENYLINLNILDIVKEGLSDYGIELESLYEFEPEPGLGNGGLGRLAACFLDSMAALGIHGVGMGIRYHFGLFKQRIYNGYQFEDPDSWLSNGYQWEIPKPEQSVIVKFGGVIERRFENGRMYFEHKNYNKVRAVPFDVPIVGYGGQHINTLHLWDAQPVTESIDMEAFNQGHYTKAMQSKCNTEALTCILYPDDSTIQGKELRLQQEYFLVAAGMASIIKRFKARHGENAWNNFPDYVSVHINDTHPTLCVPELMRILMDDEGLEWDEAWEITKKTMSFTNHTVLPEALEKWSIPSFQKLLPRIYMIIEEIDKRWREYLQNSSQADLAASTAILWNNEVKMANLCIIGSHSVNGVAALHTEILKKSVFHDFYSINPGIFNNKTNGISHRRFLIQSNPELSSLITDTIGKNWKKNFPEIERLLDFRKDKGFLDALADVKKVNKQRLADFIRKTNEIDVDPDSVFDIQVKRIHAYKRQLLNAFKILTLYNRIKENPNLPIHNHTFIFAGKAAQGYAYAKETIKFVNSVADMVNSDPVVSSKIKVVYIENFCVSNAQLIYPAADVSEQISTAGKEASGTGNMKFMMNGAITLGTLDGANIEIRNLVGEDNMLIFGITAEEAANYMIHGGYNSNEVCNNNHELQKITSQLIDGFFEKCGYNFWSIYDSLLQHNDEYFVLQDFASYMNAWSQLNEIRSDRYRWLEMSLVNIAKSHYFSSDRTIKEYADEIWHI